MSAPARTEPQSPAGYRKCEFRGCNTNARMRACCEQGRQADKKGT
jgi:hypothetical protein